MILHVQYDANNHTVSHARKHETTALGKELEKKLQVSRGENENPHTQASLKFSI